MNKILCTFGWGEWASLWLDVTRPSMKQYADFNGYTFIEPSERDIGEEAHAGKFAQDASWCKVLYALQALERGDQFLWIDADVLIVRKGKDIADEVPQDSNMALAKHYSDPYQWHPNCGVWFLNPTHTTVDVLKKVRDMEPQQNSLSEKMWEQGALMEIMGARFVNPRTSRGPVVLPEEYPFEWHELDMEWNCSSADKREWPIYPRFLHASAHPQYKHQILRTWKALTKTMNGS